MINHARTLLLNVAGSHAQPADYPAEEFVPSTFTALALSRELTSVRNVLFGINPDRAMLNYRLRQYMTLLHSTELESYVTDLDSRITYWPSKDESTFSFAAYGITATQLNAPARNVYFSGDIHNFTDYSRLLHKWQATVDDGTHVTVQRLTRPYLSDTQTYSASGGLSSLITLPNTELSFRFDEGTGSVWLIQAYARPARTLPDVLNDLEISSVVNSSSTLFSSAEPYATFQTLWLDKNNNIAFRLGAVILALVYRMHAQLTE